MANGSAKESHVKEIKPSRYVSSFLPCKGWVVWLQQDTEIVPAFPGHFCFKEILLLKERVLFLDIKTVKQREDFTWCIQMKTEGPNGSA